MDRPILWKEQEFDLVVCGGGMGGVCAAITAARRGIHTVLVQNRPVLGGNASSEVRVHIGGVPEHGYHYDGRETGVIEELRLETAVRDPRNEYFWIDAVLLGACRAEPNLKVILNANVDDVEVEHHRVVAVRATQLGSETRWRLAGKYFIDATGDGTVGFMANAEYRDGRESWHEFDESLAPDRADTHVLGSSILFCARDLGRPVPYAPPDWALQFTAEDLRHRRGTGKNINHEEYWHSDTVGWWWVEYGGTLDTIHCNEEVRNKLHAIIYGLWDWIKNRDPRTRKQARNFAITWIGQVPGKRESRRLMGDYILREQDLRAGRVFPDQIAVGGWSIDLHPPAGFFAKSPGAVQTALEGPYSIPFRSIYSRNVSNLLIASRCLSVTHVAHGSTRLIATLACVGQAAGTAVALCHARGCTPRQLYREHVADLQQELLKEDQFLLGVQNEDPADMALGARVVATSERPCLFGEPTRFVPLYFPVAQRFYLPTWPRADVTADADNQTSAGTEIDMDATGATLRVFLKNTTGDEVQVHGGVRRDPTRSEFKATDDLAAVEGTVPARHEGWVSLRALPTAPETNSGTVRDLFRQGGCYWLYLDEAEGVQWGQHARHWPGFRRGYYNEDEARWFAVHPGQNPFFDPLFGFRGTMCFEIPGAPSPFPAGAITNGFPRPDYKPNLWVSGKISSRNEPPEEALEENAIEVTVTFPAPATFSQVWLTMDTDLDKAYPHQGYGREREKDWPVAGKAPECIRAVDIYLVPAGEDRRVLVHELRENYQRRVKISLSTPLTASQLVLVPRANWGASHFHLYELRVYE